MHVIFLAPHFPSNQRRFVRGLKAVGARVTGILDAPVRVLDDELRALLDDAEVVHNVTDVDQVTAAVRRVQQRGPWVHHLEAVVEAHTLTAARVREATGIPGTAAATVERCRDKALMKSFLASKGIPVAANAPIDSPADARAFVREHGFPVILKPRDGAGAAGTVRASDEHALERALAQVPWAPGRMLIEAFIEGHELIYDTLTVGGVLARRFVSHYEPGVLHAMRTRHVSPRIVTTNRLDHPSYAPLHRLAEQVNAALGLHTCATHMEVFASPRGLIFSEIGARPPGVSMWDAYCEALGHDLYTEWARAVCWGDVRGASTPLRAAGMVAIRPDRDGRIRGYQGADTIQQRWGDAIFRAHLPPVGSPTQPVEAGYMANAWAMVAHDDYDACCHILDDIGRTLKVFAA